MTTAAFMTALDVRSEEQKAPAPTAAPKRSEQYFAELIRLGGWITYTDEDGNRVIQDRNGVHPHPGRGNEPGFPESAELDVIRLAYEHRIPFDPAPGPLDTYADDLNRLADGEVHHDRIERIIVELRRLDVIDGIELTKLHARYLAEKNPA